MTSAQVPKSPRWFTGPTRLVTIASIVAVGFAGAAAVSANIGILDSTSDSPVGSASVTDDLITANRVTPSTQVVDVFLPGSSDGGSATTVSVPGRQVQQFMVDVAGTVAVAVTDAGLSIDEVRPAAGWNWNLTRSDSVALVGTMSNGSRTFEFTATMTAAGQVDARVNELIVKPAPSTNSGVSGSSDDDTSYDDSNDDSNDDSHSEFESEDEDEHNEYEGGDDDD